jgi:large subunit ribosomal protein L18
VYAQLINDEEGKTLASADSRKEAKGTGVERGALVGASIAKAAKAAKIETVVFDRGGFLYAGIVKAVAEGAREGGLKF